VIQVYYYLVLLNAAVGVGAAIAVSSRNRHFFAGQMVGAGLLMLAIWLTGYAQYFAPLTTRAALLWAKITLTASFINQPFALHAICAYVGQAKRWRWWLGIFYGAAAIFLVLLWNGNLVTGLRSAAYMDHYVRYDHDWYQFLGMFYISTVLLGLVVLAQTVRRAVGYQRAQLVYFIISWAIVIATTYCVVVPIEYGISVQPFGFFLMPINTAFLAYALAKTRLADYNVVVARVLIYAVTILVVTAFCLVFIGVAAYSIPGFLGTRQVVFTVLLTAVIAMALVIIWPRLLPRAERIMQERMFSRQHGYQDTLSGFVREVGHVSSLDELLQKVATTIHAQMQLMRVLILTQDPLSGDYRLQTESGLPAEEATDLLKLTEDAGIIRWLRKQKNTLVLDELRGTESTPVLGAISEELNRLKVVACVPMILDHQLVGLLALGPKASRDMFYGSDLKVLETLATEVALAVRYRRMEEQAIRNNKLVALGTIAAGVAHEIRNPLASIRTFAQLLPTKLDDPEFRDEFSKLVLQDVERITKVIQSMLSFARPATINVGNHTAEELIEEALTLVQPRLRGKSIEVTKHLPQRLTLSVDKQQILQVLLNILNNAVDALPAGGVIRITTGIQPPENKIKPTESGFAIIAIADNGPGIPAAARARLFDPFFTTKPEGTGLGLSISQKIARDHNGFIAVSSTEGMGATFQIHLPLAETGGSDNK